jgi:hypothetical protein
MFTESAQGPTTASGQQAAMPLTRGFMPLAKTRIDGLYLASAFTGGGYTGAILGGGWAARAAIAARPH